MKTKYTFTSQKEVRDAFKYYLSDVGSKDMTPTDIRCSFVEYVDLLQKDGTITEKLASRVTLA